NTQVCVLIDVGTKLGSTSIYNFCKAFDINPHLGVACGEIVAMKGRAGVNLLNPLVASQNFEFFFLIIRHPPISTLFPYTTLFRSSLLLALRLLWKTPIFPSNSRFPRLCAKCLLKLKRLVSILPMTKSKK